MYARELSWSDLGGNYRIVDGENAYEGTLWRVDVELGKIYDYPLCQDPETVEPSPGQTYIRINIGNAEGVHLSPYATAEEI